MNIMYTYMHVSTYGHVYTWQMLYKIVWCSSKVQGETI
jgi:hypothetical protein